MPAPAELIEPEGARTLDGLIAGQARRTRYALMCCSSVEAGGQWTKLAAVQGLATQAGSITRGPPLEKVALE
jgi:hypothetical protein